MALATQCPHCKTTFRVAQDQLKLRSGLVRCGSCKQIFNGIEHLLAAETQTTAAPTPPLSRNAPHPSVSFKRTLEPQAPADIVAPAIEDTQAQLVQDTIPGPVPDTENLHSEPEPARASDVPDSNEDDPLLGMTLINFEQIDDGRIEPSLEPIASNPPDAHERLSVDVQKHNTSSTVSNPEIPAEPKAEDSSLADNDTEPNAATEPHLAEDHASSEELSTTDLPEASATASEEGSQGRGWARNALFSHNAEEEQHDEAVEPEFVRKARQQAKIKRIQAWVFGIGSLLLLLSAAAEAAYSFRSPLAAYFPQTQIYLSMGCKWLHCTIELPTQIDHLTIQSDELQTLADNKEVSQLSLLLRNDSGVAQAWPYLELTIIDNSEKAIARRIFKPSDYLDKNIDSKKGFPGDSEQAIKVLLDLTALKATGYRVGLFYP